MRAAPSSRPVQPRSGARVRAGCGRGACRGSLFSRGLSASAASGAALDRLVAARRDAEFSVPPSAPWPSERRGSGASALNCGRGSLRTVRWHGGEMQDLGEHGPRMRVLPCIQAPQQRQRRLWTGPRKTKGSVATLLLTLESLGRGGGIRRRRPVTTDQQLSTQSRVVNRAVKDMSNSRRSALPQRTCRTGSSIPASFKKAAGVESPRTVAATASNEHGNPFLSD